MKPDTYHRAVYLPKGEWVNYWTDDVIQGGRHIIIDAPLETLPIYIKKGSIITHGAIKHSTMVPETRMQIHLYPDTNGESSYTLYDDDGETFAYQKGDFLLKKITCRYSENNIDVSIKNIHSNYKPSWEQWTLIIHNAKQSMKISINDILLPSEKLVFNHEKHTLSIPLFE